MTPGVSVVVAARDAAATLRETLESIAAQTFTDWEVVLVDDGSTDGTADLARSVLPTVRVIRHETPRGPSAARNAGATTASQAFVACLDSDDVWLPAYLERQVALLEATPQAAVACCDALVRRGSGPIEGQTFRERTGTQQTPARQLLRLDELLRENVVFTSVLMRREAFLRHGGYAEDLVHGEDFDLWLRMTAAGDRIVVNPEALAVYRLRADGLTADTERISAATAEVYRRALERGGLDARQRRLARRQRRLHALNAARAAGAAGRLQRALVAAEHPERWAAWLRRGVRDIGPGRHG